MSIRLFVEAGSALDLEPLDAEIYDEIASGVQESPDMDVFWRRQALIVIENILALATDEEHGCC